MSSLLKQSTRPIVYLLFVAMIALLAASPRVLAQTHVVSSAELHQQTLDATRARTANLDKVSEFLSSPTALKALRIARMDSEEVKIAASSLSDQELAQLAARADKAQTQFAAGNLSDRDLLLIVVGIAALILIIVAVR